MEFHPSLWAGLYNPDPMPCTFSLSQCPVCLPATTVCRRQWGLWEGPQHAVGTEQPMENSPFPYRSIQYPHFKVAFLLSLTSLSMFIQVDTFDTTTSKIWDSLDTLEWKFTKRVSCRWIIYHLCILLPAFWSSKQLTCFSAMYSCSSGTEVELAVVAIQSILRYFWIGKKLEWKTKPSKPTIHQTAPIESPCLVVKSG